MINIKAKIKRIFIPYLIISVVTLIVSTYLHWLLFIKLDIPRLGGLLVLIVPLVLSLISILIWLNRRIKLRTIKRGSILEVLYILVPCVSMGGLSIFGQQYFMLANSKLTHLSSISQIEQKESSKFYALKNFYLDKKHFSIEKQFNTSGKFNQNLEMYTYITVPILNSVKDTLGAKCIGWYGVKYMDTVDGFVQNHDTNESYWLTDEEIENSFEVKKFINESMMKFNNLNLNHFQYLDRIAKNETDYNGYVSAIDNNTKYSTKSKIVLLPYKESLTERANDDLKVALSIFGLGSLVFLIMVIYAKLKSEEV